MPLLVCGDNVGFAVTNGVKLNKKTHVFVKNYASGGNKARKGYF